MKKPWFVWLLRTLLLLSVAAASPAAALEPEDFARGLELVTDSDTKLQTLSLPSQIITQLTDPAFADACLFDERGQQVPHALYLPEERPVPVELQVPFHPIEARAGGNQTVTVERDAKGGIVRAITQSTEATGEPEKAFLVDGSALEAPIGKLWLSVQTATAPIVRMNVDASDDLDEFRPVAKGTLTQLARTEHDLTTDSLPLPNTRARYLRLTFPEAPGDLRLSRVKLTTRRLVELPRQTVDVPPLSSTHLGRSVFRYAAPGAVQTDRYLLQLPEGTALIEATLSSSASEAGPYHPRLTRTFARGDQALQPIAVEGDRYFELRVSDKGGGVHAGAPKLRVGFLPLTLSFLAEGKATYLLAYGSVRARCAHFTEAALRAQVRDAAQAVPRVGRSRTLGGDAALQPAAPPVPYRVYALWTILLVAVAALAVIARKLLKQA
jgi:hypothetical protein